MTQASYAELQNQIAQCFTDQDYQQAYDLATEGKAAFPERAAFLDYYRMCTAARAGKPDLALQVLAAALEAGRWYGEHILTASPSLAPLLDLPAYTELVARSTAMAAADAPQEAAPKIIAPQGAAQPYPLLLALHSNGASVETDHIFWHSLLPAGWLLAFPESPVAMYKGAYIWDDREKILPAVTGAYEAACRDYPIDRGRVILAGHSLGAQQAIWMALNETIPNIGFIAVGPYIPEEEAQSWTALIERRAGSGLRGVMLYGEADDSIPQDSLLALAARMNSQHIPVQVKSFPSLGHDFAAPVQQELTAAVDFVSPPRRAV